jgi:hypothetical protein
VFGVARRNGFPSVRLQPLGHLSGFRINNLRAVGERLSHTPCEISPSNVKPRGFNDLQPENASFIGELRKTSQCRSITYERSSLPTAGKPDRFLFDAARTSRGLATE